MGRVAVQIDMQSGITESKCLFTNSMFKWLPKRLALEVITKGGIARRVVHMAWLSGDEPALQCVAIRVFQRRNDEVGLRLTAKLRRSTQHPHHAGGFVGMLPRTDHNGAVTADDITRLYRSPRSCLGV